MKSRLVKIVSVFVLLVLSIGLVSVSYFNMNANAETTSEDINVIKQNITYKTVYANLEKCYTAMKTPITESFNNTWAAYDSDTYFTDDARESSYLKFPYGVGGKNTASCPGMITGWHTNWFINLFTGDGSYDGLLAINKDAEVPETNWYNSSTNKMGTFLQNLGYTLTLSGADNVGNRSCFYIKATLDEGAVHYWYGSSTSKSDLTPPLNGSWTFETPDYCVSLGSDGNFSLNSDVLVLTGNNGYFTTEYDNGHLTDDSNVIFPFFVNGMEPQWRHHTVINPDLWYHVAIWDYIDFRYPYINAATQSQDLMAESLDPKAASKAKHFKDDAGYDEYCFNLGYKVCGVYNGGGWFESDWVFSSILYANESVSYSTYKDRLAGIFDKAMTDDNEYIFDNVQTVDYTPQTKTYNKGSSNATYISYFLKDVSKYNSGKFNDAEKYILYWTYLKDHYNVNTRSSTVDNGVLVSWLQDDGTFAQKYVYDPDEDLSDKKYVLGTDDKWNGSTQQDWKWIAQQLAAIDVETAFSAEVEPILDEDLDPPEDDDDDGKTEPDCYTNSGSLGWILCPIIDGAGNAIVDIYENYVTKFLVLDTALFQSGAGTTYDAWTQFQQYANIIFIIMFLVVVISQLTGYGIDNYGIKKILPKLIIAAILINMSYIICQLAVDISNIVGYGVKSLFDGIGRVDLNSISLAEAPGAKNAFTATGILVVLVGLLVTPAILSNGWGVLVPVFLVIISIVVAIITLFVLLALRKALAIVLVVISPLAFVCYMLPNTKSLFNKWFAALKGTLLAFPICSAMVFGGQAVARIVISVANSTELPSAMALSAAVMSIAPVFLIPSVLKKSMGAISSLVDRASGRVNKFARGRAAASRAMKYLRNQGEQRALARQNEFNNRRANRTASRLEGRVQSGRATASQRRAYLSAMGTKSSYDAEQQRAYATSFANASPQQIAETFTNMIQNGKYDKNMASAAIQNLSEAGKHDILNNMLGNMDGDFIANMDSSDKAALGKQLAGLKKDNIAAALYGKKLAENSNEAGFRTDMKSYMRNEHGFSSDVKNAGKNIIASQDDSTLSYIAGQSGASFTTEQMRNSIGNLDTKQQNAVNGMWSNMSDDQTREVFSGMSTDQYAKVDEDLARAVGGGDLGAGRTTINGFTQKQRLDLMSENNTNLRAAQNESQRNISDWNMATADEKKAAGGDWSTASSEVKDNYYNSNPRHAGETDADYMARIVAKFQADNIKASGYRNV